LVADPGPGPPFLHNFFTVHEHGAEDDARWNAATFLTVVNHEGLPHILGKGAVQLMFQLIHIIDSCAFADLVEKLRIVVFCPSIYTLPGVGNRGWRGKAVFE
jgi:hypothetical protein